MKRRESVFVPRVTDWHILDELPLLNKFMLN